MLIMADNKIPISTENILDFLGYGLYVTGNYDFTMAIFSAKWSNQKNKAQVANGTDLNGSGSNKLIDLSVGWNGYGTSSQYTFRTTEGFNTIQSTSTSTSFSAYNVTTPIGNLDQQATQIAYAWRGKTVTNSSIITLASITNASNSKRFVVTIPANTENILIECSNDDTGAITYSQTTTCTGLIFGKYVTILAYVDYVNNQIKLIIDGKLVASSTPAIGGAIPNTNSNGINFMQNLSGHTQFCGFVKNKVFTTNELIRLSNFIYFA